MHRNSVNEVTISLTKDVSNNFSKTKLLSLVIKVVNNCYPYATRCIYVKSSQHDKLFKQINRLEKFEVKIP